MNFNLKFYRKSNDDWILMREFYHLQFCDFDECEKFAVEFLKTKCKRHKIKTSVKYSIEEI